VDRARQRRSAELIPLPARRIGLFGGSFDPPHIGHVALVQAAVRLLPLDELRVVPAGLPVHRELSGRSTSEQRLKWLQVVFAGLPGVSVWDWEVRREMPTSTAETLRYLASTDPEAQLLLLLGADAFAGMESWREYPLHRQLCDVAVFTRKGVARPQLAGWQEMAMDEWLAGHGTGRVIYLDADLPEISATGLRDELAEGAAAPAGLPDAIAAEVAAVYRKH